ncbi:MAG: hypothetical protein CVT95_09840, partial [Bacteroidetes bacterium HGW-Bacteroidetes-12]
SYKLLIAGIGYSISSNIYPMVIGKVFTLGDVGFFNRAKGLKDLPVLMFTGIIQQVTLPTFSNIQEETTRFFNAYRKAIKTSLFLVLLPLLVFIVSAEPLVELLLTSKWLPAAYMLRIIAIGSIFYPVSALNINIIGIKGRSDYVMILQFIKDGFIFAGALIGLVFGIDGLLWSMAITGNIGFLINIYFTSKVIKYPIKNQLRDLFPVIMLASLAGIISYVSTLLIFGSNLFLIIVQTSLIGVLYIGIAWLFNLPELKSSVELIKKMIK